MSISRNHDEENGMSSRMYDPKMFIISTVLCVLIKCPISVRYTWGSWKLFSRALILLVSCECILTCIVLLCICQPKPSPNISQYRGHGTETKLVDHSEITCM